MCFVLQYIKSLLGGNGSLKISFLKSINLNDNQKDIAELILGYSALTILHICIMFIFGWYAFHIGYLIAAVVMVLLFSLPVGFLNVFKKNPWLLRFILFLFNTVMTYFYTETITKYLAPSRIFCPQFVICLVLTFCLYLFFMAVTGKFSISVYVTNILIGIICISNRIPLDLRGRPLFVSDFTSIGTAMSVSSSYQISYIKFFIILLIFVLISVYTVTLYKLLGNTNDKFSVCARICGIVAVIAVLLVSYCTDLYKNFNIQLTYWSHQNGILLDWLMESKDYKVKTPGNYSVESIEAVKEDFKPSDNIAEYDGIKPNIIVIMNESFSDLGVINNFNTDIDYIPFLRTAMNGNYDDMIVGDAYASVFGGNTANSEYEFLTNDSMVLYPQNSVPYQTFLDGKGEISSLVSQLKALGYKTTSMHPYWSSGWNRINIYKYMGFDNQYYLDNMTNIDYIRNYCSDSCDYRKLIELFENRDKSVPFFMFNITMQNHGGYTTPNYTSTVHLTDYSGQFPMAQQYLSLIRESDKALFELIKYFRTVEEPTVIVFFGDHQPSVENEFFEMLYDKPMGELTDAERLKMYITKYIVWKNFKTENFEIGDTSINYLSALVLKMIGLPTTSYQNYLLDMRENYPIVTANGVIDKEGRFIPVNEADLSFYKTIVYNHMIDNEQYKREFFENTYKIDNSYLTENYDN